MPLASCGDLVTGDEVLENVLVGPEGGSVSFDSIKVLVPEGAVDSEVNFTVVAKPDHPNGNVGPVYMVDADVESFKKPLTVKLSVDAALLESGAQYENLVLAWAEAGEWKILEGSKANRHTGVVVGETTHLSVWGAVPDPNPECIPDCTDKECGDDGCGGSCGECDEGCCGCMMGQCMDMDGDGEMDGSSDMDMDMDGDSDMDSDSDMDMGDGGNG